MKRNPFTSIAVTLLFGVLLGACGGNATLSCPEESTECSEICVNTDIDPMNCGGCGLECESGEVCMAGSCGVGCTGGTTECNGTCVNTYFDPGNCGGCADDPDVGDNICDAGEFCSDGVCGLECTGGTTECDGLCVNTMLDPGNCGGCADDPSVGDNICDTGELCSDGVCGLECMGGTTECDGLCVDTLIDPGNCGGCADDPSVGDNICDTGEICSDGTCSLECTGGTTDCDGLCVNTDSDPLNCGSCDLVCSTGNACVGGMCMPLATEITYLEPVADSYINADASTTNYGTGESLIVSPDWGGDSERQTYLRFNLAALPHKCIIVGASLTMTSFTGYAWGGDGNVYTYPVADDTWDESTIDWDTAPVADTTAALGSWWRWYDGSTSTHANSTSTPELTESVVTEYQSDGLISFMLLSTGYRTNYRSREYATAAERPMLGVTCIVPQTMSIVAEADSYINADASTTNYGTDESLVVSPDWGGDSERQTYLRFDLTDVPAGSTIVGATLTMTSYTGYAWGGNGNVYSYLVADDTWDESTITWDTAPAADTTLALGSWWRWYDGGTSTHANSTSADELGDAVITEYAGDGLISLMLASEGYRTNYRSKEYATAAEHPSLTIHFYAP